MFLQLLIKAQTNKFNFDVITINLDNPPKEFKELCIKPPVLIHGTSSFIKETNDHFKSENNAIILSDVDEIGEYLGLHFIKYLTGSFDFKDLFLMLN